MLHIYNISTLRVNDLTFILLTWRKWLASNNASRLQMGFNSGFKGLITSERYVYSYVLVFSNVHRLDNQTHLVSFSQNEEYFSLLTIVRTS